MIELKDLLEEGEVIVEYHLHNEYWSRNAITVKGSDDIELSHGNYTQIKILILLKRH